MTLLGGCLDAHQLRFWENDEFALNFGCLNLRGASLVSRELGLKGESIAIMFLSFQVNLPSCSR